ncbi:hypothetical protein D7030_04270 [Flavobacteriaceae bacterium AU392]|nr:hypothetical protein D1817_10745 [Flavobacteriaceae bacterium]RKM85893.1 hypothetical protein D7030_04270 [Flavobacteriaceae bacterium AU392]
MPKRNIVKAFEDIANKWLDDLLVYDDKQLYFKPSENKWCLAELYDHIIKVAWSYQMPNLYKCLHKRPVEGKPKNIKGVLVFNLNIVPYRKITISSFPKDIQDNFTPEIKEREELITEFKGFIKDIVTISDLLKTADLSVKNYHPFFGTINAREWFSLVEIHMRHHNRQKQNLEKLKL